MKKSILVASLLLAASNVNANADAYLGFYSFGTNYKTQIGSVGTALNGARSRDIYIITCPSGTVRINASIKDLPPVHKAPVLLQLQGTTTTLSSTTYDTIEGDIYGSSEVSINAARTTFLAHVTKPVSGYKGAENYQISANCYIRHSSGATWFAEPVSIKLYKNNLPQ
jgi:hypothetical protein